jgi:hypothetical protein
LAPGVIAGRGKRRSYTITPEALMSLYKQHHGDEHISRKGSYSRRKNGLNVVTKSILDRARRLILAVHQALILSNHNEGLVARDSPTEPMNQAIDRRTASNKRRCRECKLILAVLLLQTPFAIL